MPVFNTRRCVVDFALFQFLHEFAPTLNAANTFLNEKDEAAGKIFASLSFLIGGWLQFRPMLVRMPAELALR